MAMADYRWCDKCGCKAFYDANLNYNCAEQNRPIPDYLEPFKICGTEKHELEGYALDNVGDWGVLCHKCAEQYEINIVEKKPQEAGNE